MNEEKLETDVIVNEMIALLAVRFYRTISKDEDLAMQYYELFVEPNLRNKLTNSIFESQLRNLTNLKSEKKVIKI